MAIGLEVKGYRESETRAGKRHRNSQKVAKRDERAQELIHKAIQGKRTNNTIRIPMLIYRPAIHISARVRHVFG
jgi:hypothetical protein